LAYPQDMSAAAGRHYADGAMLLGNRKFDNAGYHFGLAAECAIKKLLRDCGVPTDDKAIWMHWPHLKTLGRLAVSGRQAGPVRELLERGNFMQHWDVVMRYSSNSQVDQARATRWQEDANEAMGLLI